MKKLLNKHTVYVKGGEKTTTIPTMMAVNMTR